MKKITKLFLGFTLLFVVCLTLAGCGSVSEDYAKKINEAAQTEEALTKEDVFKALGEPTINLVEENTKTGTATWFKGYDDLEEAYKAYDEGKKVKSITVVFALGKATLATYSEEKPSK